MLQRFFGRQATWRGKLISGSVALLLGFLIIYPTLTLLLGAFYPDPPRGLVLDFSRFTMENVVRVMGNPSTFQALWLTLVVCIGGTVLALILGVGLAWLVVRTDIPFRRLIESCAIIPLILPPFIGAMSWTLLGSPRNGILNVLFSTLNLPWTMDIFTVGGMIWVFGLYYMTYAFLFSRAALTNMDASLEEASAITGASTWQTIRRVTLPLITPTVASAGALIFVMMAGAFAIPKILGTRSRLDLLSSRIYNLVNYAPSDINGATVVGFFLVALTLIGVAIQRKTISRGSFVTVTGKVSRPKRLSLGKWRYPLCGFSLLYIVAAVILPYFALFQLAFRQRFNSTTLYELIRIDNLTLDNFVLVANHPVVTLALRNSLLLGIGTALIGSALYFLIGYYIYRTRLPLRRFADFTANLPVSLPGIVVGIAFLWAFIRLPLYGTLWILGLAYIAKFFPTGLRSASSTLLQIHPELEEQSRISGAGFWRTIQRVVAPLCRQGLLSTGILLFIVSLRELSVSIFLYTGDSVVLALAIWDLWEEGWANAVGALSLIYSLLVMALVLFARHVLKADIERI